MGTPGDKAKIGQVVQSQLDPEEEQLISATTTATTTTSTAIVPAVGVLQYVQPSTSTTVTTIPTSPSEMGVLSRLPQFETFAALNIHPSLSQATTTTTPPPTTMGGVVATKPDSFQTSLGGTLEQAHIEDYFAQSKYYPSVSENLQTLYSELPQKSSKSTTFYSLDQPAGPSGLQTTKTKAMPGLIKLNVKRTTTKKQAAASSAGPSKKGQHTCQVCQKSFVSIEKLTKHQQIHSGVSPFKCEHCKKSFSSKFKLMRHVLIHSDRKPFSCTVCERTFHRKDHLKNHIKIHSPLKKVYMCEKPDCKKEYTSILSYRKHLALHAAEEGSLECQICSSVFDTKEQVLFHLKIHAGSRTAKNPSDKKFTCEHCDRKFFTKKDVRRHLVVHTGMRDFLCQFCPQRFGRKDHLVRHIKKSHSTKMPVDVDDLETVVVKRELPETITRPPESVAIKEEFPGVVVESPSSSSSQQHSTFFDVVGEEILAGFLTEPDTDSTLSLAFLPSTSASSSQVVGELKDLGGEILQDIDDDDASLMIDESGLVDASDELLDRSVVLNDPEIQRLLQSSEEKNLPLPGFSQTFQPPPPP